MSSCHPKSILQKIKQGICGTVVVKRGNFMPGPGAPKASGSPVERDVLIFPLLNMNQVDAGDNGFINSVGESKPIKTVKSDKNGKFCVSLPAGRYSVIVREPKGLYANSFDAQNNIFPVTVQKQKQTTIKVEITHQAVF
ncbi:hypothetical protein WBJ53_01260 [Spirosoma sp. SC4-14]|uniref:hypothetical protein n=1 Tax=Spirosoma sp. SC4-14 TaxID=3128900 RepID=UPI0030CC0060